MFARAARAAVVLAIASSFVAAALGYAHQLHVSAPAALGPALSLAAKGVFAGAVLPGPDTRLF
jgi:hypothetical protein